MYEMLLSFMTKQGATSSISEMAKLVQRHGEDDQRALRWTTKWAPNDRSTKSGVRNNNCRKILQFEF